MSCLPRSAFTAVRKLWLLTALLLLSSGSFAQQADTEAELKKVSKQIQQLQQLLGEFKTERNRLQQQLRSTETNIGEIQTKMLSIRRSLQQQQQQLSSLQSRSEQLQQEKVQQQQLIEDYLASAYQLGRQSKIKLLLNQENPDQVSRALTYYDYFSKARIQQIERYVALLRDIDSNKQAIVATTSELEQARLALSNERSRLLASQKERERNLQKINAAISSKDQELQQAAKNRAELERLLTVVEEAIDSIVIPQNYQPFAKLKGQLPWPLPGKPSNRFGSSRSGSKMRWQGVTIPANEGSEVKAIHHGRVVFADWFRGSGLLLIIDHGEGYMSLYAHNQSLLREPGDWVNTGEIIATVGNSGGQQQAGLYFEIRQNGKPTNPSSWCRS